ncbi:MAG: hypothetical protein H6730_33685 [Deltaproteobacteria bacterium]|nr:hypothetical protein [Deltaproteobacteria bacterium]
MAYINHAVREINVKVVLAGPQSQDILRYLHAKAAPTSRSALDQLALPDGGEVVFFELVPAGLGAIRGYRLRLHLHAVVLEGQAESDLWRHVMPGAEGLILLARPDRLVEAEALRSALIEAAEDHVPTVALVVGGDPGAVARASDALKVQAFAVGADPEAGGAGPFDALKAITKALLLRMKEGVEAPASPATPTRPVGYELERYSFTFPDFWGPVELSRGPSGPYLRSSAPGGIEFSAWVRRDADGSPSDDPEFGVLQSSLQDIERFDATIARLPFAGVRGQDAAGKRVEVYAGRVGPDVVGINLTLGPECTNDPASLRKLAFVMTEGAIIRAMAQAPGRFTPQASTPQASTPQARPGFFKRLLGRG